MPSNSSRRDASPPNSAQLLTRLDERHDELLSRIDELNDQILQALETVSTPGGEAQ